MEKPITRLLKDALTEKLVESLAGPIPEGTPRQLYGATRLPGKAHAGGGG